MPVSSCSSARLLPVLAAGAALLLSACGTTGGTHGGWTAGGAGSARPASAAGTPAGRTARPASAAGVPPTRPPLPEHEAAAPGALLIPVAGVPASRLRDSFLAPRSGGRIHHAIDIAAPTGTPVLAVTDGMITRRHWNGLGGNTLYLRSADGRYDFYYAHLHTYAEGIVPGRRVRRGEVLGTVGATGNAVGPHLHFQVLDLRGGGRGTPVNPYDLLTTPALAGTR
ncbi:MAG: M23 family metallopeptidase [Rubricoccaceae bacterium]